VISAKAVLRTDMDPIRLLRIFTVIPVVLILLAGAGAFWIYFFVVSLLPEGDSVVHIPGLAAEVKVVRDRSGVPGIIADKEEDLALVLGYVMAQDRLWQIDYLRRAGQGRLAEILGSDYLKGDMLMRTLRTGAQNRDYSAVLDEREQRWLDHFVQGVNRYIVSRAAKPPVEFSLLEYRPALFSAEDVKSICVALAWETSPAGRIDPLMTRIFTRLGKDRAQLLLPSDPASFHGTVSADLVGWNPTGIIFSWLLDGRGFPRVPAFTGGAVWAVGRDRSASGSPLTGCSVYQRLAAPGFWYRARLTAPDFQLSGAFIPGVPAALVGNNDQVNWGCVSAAVDDADLYIERLDSDAPRSYWRIDRWKKLQEARETFRIRGGSSEARTIQLTDTGPLVSEVSQGHALSVRWTGRDGPGIFPALCRLNRAANGDQVKSALRLLHAPGVNVVWADKGGNYGIQEAGRVPVRPAESDGILPMPAWTGVHDWRGFVPFDELPTVTNPTRGFAVAADGRPGNAQYPYLVSCYWSDESKSLRIRDMIKDVSGHQKESFQKIQTDTLSPLARDLTPVLLKALHGRAGKSSEEEQAIKTLSSWDFRMAKNSPGAAAFGLFYQSLLEDMFLKPLGEQLYAGFAGCFPLASRVVTRTFVRHENGWLAGADPADVLTRSFRKGMAKGKSLVGGDPAKWQWGEIHTALFRHPVAARSRFLEALYQVGPVGMPGSGDTINCASWSAALPFHVLDGVSLRQITDMTDPPQVFAVAPLGSSAHFFSAHYKDETRAWLEGRFFQEPLHTTEIRKTGGNAVLFKPGMGPLSRQ
jgi:penicillin G amidase